MTILRLHNTRTRRKEEFTPLDPAHVGVYLCGPTVYDRAHIGNARNVVFFDILTRLLRRLYPRVTYVRNITDIDDKINARAAASGESIASITARTTADYHADIAALHVLPPDIEPRATAHIPEMIEIIQLLIAGGHAYEAEGHVLFAVGSDADYGKFSGRSPEDLLAGARVDVAPYKRDPGDFVLWKPSSPDLPGWESPWGRGRPGWHIECSAMSWKHLGENFDIHGGGDDLIFPHHENEIAQSCCAFPGSKFANVWVHNRMLLVNGEKMSKSLGNFLVLHEVLDKVRGEDVRFMLMRTHYRSTLDFSDSGLVEAGRELDRFYRAIEKHPGAVASEIPDTILEPLCDDLNTPGAIAGLHGLADAAFAGDAAGASGMIAAGEILGLFNDTYEERFQRDKVNHGHGRAILGPVEARGEIVNIDEASIIERMAEREAARSVKDFKRADEIRNSLEKQGIVLEDHADRPTTWRRKN
jgi:cysteinyl-tRNA synthetase